MVLPKRKAFIDALPTLVQQGNGFCYLCYDEHDALVVPPCGHRIGLTCAQRLFKEVFKCPCCSRVLLDTSPEHVDRFPLNFAVEDARLFHQFEQFQRYVKGAAYDRPGEVQDFLDMEIYIDDILLPDLNNAAAAAAFTLYSNAAEQLHSLAEKQARLHATSAVLHSVQNTLSLLYDQDITTRQLWARLLRSYSADVLRSTPQLPVFPQLPDHPRLNSFKCDVIVLFDFIVFQANGISYDVSSEDDSDGMDGDMLEQNEAAEDTPSGREQEQADTWGPYPFFPNPDEVDVVNWPQDDGDLWRFFHPAGWTETAEWNGVPGLAYDQETETGV